MEIRDNVCVYRCNTKLRCTCIFPKQGHSHCSRHGSPTYQSALRISFGGHKPYGPDPAPAASHHPQLCSAEKSYQEKRKPNDIFFPHQVFCLLQQCLVLLERSSRGCSEVLSEYNNYNKVNEITMNSENASFVPSSLGYVSADQNRVIGRQLILLSARACSLPGANPLAAGAHHLHPRYHKLMQITAGHLIIAVLKKAFEKKKKLGYQQ